jgi:hypothetical protein
MAEYIDAPEFMFDEDDANNIAVPFKRVMDDAGIGFKDKKLEAAFELALAVGFVMTPKVKAYGQRKRGDHARNITPRPAPNGADPAQGGELDFTKMTQGKFH